MDDATVNARGLARTAAICIGLAVADSRPRVIAVETAVAATFVVAAAAADSPERAESFDPALSDVGCER